MSALLQKKPVKDLLHWFGRDFLPNLAMGSMFTSGGADTALIPGFHLDSGSESSDFATGSAPKQSG